ncbi:MAG: hypothetical protein ACYSU7_02925 [Planctomycetota bacterium]|jgi:hypothetical protein
MTTQANTTADVATPSSPGQPAGCLRAFWDIGEESFRTLISARYRSIPAAGVSDAERRLRMLGDELLTRPTCVYTRVVGIGLEPGAVWPWLAQMMRGGGVYGWPALETARCRSADYLLDGLAAPQVGDHLGDVLEVAAVDPPREIVWQAPEGLEILGFNLRALTLDYLLRPDDDGGCRLLVRMSGCCDRLTSQVRGYLCELVDFLLPAHQVETIQRLAETYSARLALGRVNRDMAGRHQALAVEPGPA